jgi:anti-anti-sigma factor
MPELPQRSRLRAQPARTSRTAIRRRRRDTVIRVYVAGEVDLASAPALIRRCRRPPGASRLLLDLAATTFIDASGLHALLGASQDWGAGLEIIPSAALMRLASITGMEDRLPLRGEPKPTA